MTEDLGAPSGPGNPDRLPPSTTDDTPAVAPLFTIDNDDDARLAWATLRAVPPGGLTPELEELGHELARHAFFTQSKMKMMLEAEQTLTEGD